MNEGPRYSLNVKEGYSYWTWWIIRSALSKHTLGWIFVIRQGGQVTSSRGKAPSDDFY